MDSFTDATLTPNVASEKAGDLGSPYMVWLSGIDTHSREDPRDDTSYPVSPTSSILGIGISTSTVSTNGSPHLPLFAKLPCLVKYIFHTPGASNESVLKNNSLFEPAYFIVLIDAVSADGLTRVTIFESRLCEVRFTSFFKLT